MNTTADNWEILFTASSAADLYSAKNYLESEGIETLLQNELAAQIYGNAADKAKILVKEHDVEKATKTLVKGGYLK